jgi:hypothetical protein
MTIIHDDQPLVNPSARPQVCQALQLFWDSCQDEMEWEQSQGWEGLAAGCASVIAPDPPPQQPPAYCAWFGLHCCTPGDVAAGRCGAVHAVKALNMKVNSVNCSLSSDAVLDSLEQLHACGLRGLDLEGNELSGSLGPRWGSLNGLTTLDLGAGRVGLMRR